MKTEKEQVPAAEKLLHLQNKERKHLVLRLRQSHPGEEKAIIRCIRDEYKETYFKRDFYKPEYLKKEAASGRITFLVAENQEGGIVGMLILKEFYPEESMCEIASQIFKKQYRGYGLAKPFFEYGMRILKSRSYSAAYCLSVLFHDITQRLMYGLGLRAVGMLLNVFDLAKITHSYENGRNTKHSQGIQVMAVNKQDAGTLYIPKEHKAFVGNIYDRLKVQCRICTEEKEESLPAGGSIQYLFDAEQSSMEIYIKSVGMGALEHIRLLESTYPLKGKTTYNVLLNVNDASAIRAYRVLKKRGYFFTGLKVLCSEREYMVLHHPGEVTVYLEDYVLSSEFSIIASYVKSCYKERYGKTGKAGA